MLFFWAIPHLPVPKKYLEPGVDRYLTNCASGILVLNI